MLPSTCCRSNLTPPSCHHTTLKIAQVSKKGGFGWPSPIVGSFSNGCALKPHHTFAFTSDPVLLCPSSIRCSGKCALFSGRNFSPTSTPAPISVAFSLFFRFYNKLDLRKNRSPFISGGLMVSKRAAHNKNTPWNGSFGEAWREAAMEK